MAFQIDGVGFTIAKADWIDRPVATSLAGETIKNRWRLHRWQTNVMTAANYDTLFDSEKAGQLVSLTTTNYNDRNNATHQTYYNAEMRSVTATHDGPRFVNVTVEFMVRL